METQSRKWGQRSKQLRSEPRVLGRQSRGVIERMGFDKYWWKQLGYWSRLVSTNRLSAAAAAHMGTVDSIQPAVTTAAAGATATTSTATTAAAGMEPAILEPVECLQPNTAGWLGLQSI